MVDSNTLAAMRAGGGAITAYCIPTHDCSCYHSVQLDLDRLIAQLGADFTIYQNPAGFTGRLRCSRCGRRNAEIRIAAGHVPVPGSGYLSGAYSLTVSPTVSPRKNRTP